jgi:hypothetical protein
VALRVQQASIAALTTQEMAELAELRSLGPEEDPGILDSQLLEGKATMDAIRVQLANIEQSETARIAARETHEERLDNLAVYIIAASVPVGLLGGLGAIWLFSGGVLRRVHVLEHNASALEEGWPLEPLGPGDDEVGRLGLALERASALLATRTDAALEASRQKSEFWPP